MARKTLEEQIRDNFRFEYPRMLRPPAPAVALPALAVPEIPAPKPPKPEKASVVVLRGLLTERESERTRVAMAKATAEAAIAEINGDLEKLTAKAPAKKK